MAVNAQQQTAKEQAVGSLRTTLLSATAQWQGTFSFFGDNTAGQVLANLAADGPRIDALESVLWSRVTSGEKDFAWWVAQAKVIDDDIRFNAQIYEGWGLLSYLSDVAGATVSDIKNDLPSVPTVLGATAVVALLVGVFFVWQVTK